MFKYGMQRKIFYNEKSINKNEKKKKIALNYKQNIKKVVDINILLNRVKIDEKNEIRKKIIFFSIVSLAIILLGKLVIIIK